MRDSLDFHPQKGISELYVENNIMAVQQCHLNSQQKFWTQVGVQLWFASFIDQFSVIKIAQNIYG